MHHFDRLFSQKGILHYYCHVIEKLTIPSRIYIGFIVLNIVFITTLGLSFINGIDPTLFFAMIMILIAFAAIAASFLSTFYAYASSYNPIYTQSFSMGQGLGGTIPSLYSFILLLAMQSENQERSERSYEGPAYFGVAVLISIGCYILYIRMLRIDNLENAEDSLRNRCSISNTIKEPEISFLKKQNQKNDSFNINDDEHVENIPPLSENSFKAVYRLSIGATFHFLVTLALYPSITSKILSTDSETFLSSYIIALHFLCK